MRAGEPRQPGLEVTEQAQEQVPLLRRRIGRKRRALDEPTECRPEELVAHPQARLPVPPPQVLLRKRPIGDGVEQPRQTPLDIREIDIGDRCWYRQIASTEPHQPSSPAMSRSRVILVPGPEKKQGR